MHVLVAAHDFYPDEGSGGTGRYVHETASRLVDRGHRVSVITRRRGDDPARESIRGIDVYRYDLSVADTPAHRVLAQLPAAATAVARHVQHASESGSPDVVHLQGPVTAPLTMRVLPESVPSVCTFHSPWPTEYRLRTRPVDRHRLRRELNARLRRFLEARVLDRTDRIVTLSEFMRRTLERVYASGTPTTVVPGGVDRRRFAPDVGRYEPMAGDEFTFLTVRRLSPRMGHDVLLEAFSTVCEHGSDARLCVAGDGPLRDRLERRARTLGVDDRTTFLGYVPDEDLPMAYATADVFVLPTTALEGFGLATLEALAAGTPVVGTAAGATPEVLGPLAERAGIPAPLLVEPGDPGALASAMRAWMDRPDSERERAARVCRTYARECYPWGRTVDGLETVYERAVTDPSRETVRA